MGKENSNAITVKMLRDEVNLERWDRKGVHVKARCDETEFLVTGIYTDRDALVLDLEIIDEKTDEDANESQPQEGAGSTG